MAYKTISVDVDIDISDALTKASLADLIVELHNRKEYKEETLVECIERLSGRIISSFTDEELSEWIIKKVRR